MCAHLGIDHEVVDLREAFYQVVVRSFVREYAAARTPNPCICCNHELKFGLLLDHALAAGDELLATGHYARLEAGSSDWRLLRGVEGASPKISPISSTGSINSACLVCCFRWARGARWMWSPGPRREGCRRPRESKARISALLPMATIAVFCAPRRRRRSSQAPFSMRRVVELGQHRGLALYTVGQREGFGIAVGEPLYVSALDAERNALVVGPLAESGKSRLAGRSDDFCGWLAAGS